MEIKCKVCGTINDGETNFCKGCFVKLDIENPDVVSYNPKENEISASIIEKEENNVLWNNDEENDSLIVEENIEFKPIEDDYIPTLVENEIQLNVQEFKPIEDNEEMVTTELVNDFEVMKDLNETAEEIKTDELNNEFETINDLDKTVEEIEDNNQEEIELEEEKIIEVGHIVEQEKNDNKVEIEYSFDNQNENVELIETIPEVWEEEKSELPELDMSELDKNDDWNDEIDENESKQSFDYLTPSKLFVKFLLNCLLFGVLFGALCIGFRYLLTNLFETGNEVELIFIVISSISSIATLLISTDRTFKKHLPLATKINTTSFMLLFLVALPYLLIKLAYNLFIGTTFVIFLILIALTLVILAIFFNYMRTLIRNRHEIKTDDKAILIYGIFSILLVVLTLFGVYKYKDKDYNISFDILWNDSENVELVRTYILEVEKSIQKNKTEIDGYDIPDKIENVEFAVIDGNRPDGMVLYLNEEGKVISGTIIIGQNVYSYDGEKIKAN